MKAPLLQLHVFALASNLRVSNVSCLTFPFSVSCYTFLKLITYHIILLYTQSMSSIPKLIHFECSTFWTSSPSPKKGAKIQTRKQINSGPSNVKYSLHETLRITDMGYGATLSQPHSFSMPSLKNICWKIDGSPIC